MVSLIMGRYDNETPEARKTRLKQQRAARWTNMTPEKREQVLAQKRAHYKTNRVRLLAQKKEAYNAEAQRASNRARYVEKKEVQRAYERERYHSNTSVKLAKLLRGRLVSATRHNFKAGSAVSDLGCTITQLRAYLEALFLPGMTWDNWTREGWHIDHIIPLASFNLTDRDQFLAACHYTNLQPMWAEDNYRKGAKCGTLTI